MKTRFFALAALVLSLAACTQDEAGFLPEGAEAHPSSSPPRAESRRDSHRRHPCPRGWQLDGCAERGSPNGRHGEGIRRNALHRRPHQRHADLHRPVLLDQPQRHHRHSVVFYTAGETTPPAVKVKANQSAQKDFEGSDLIVADGQTVTYGSSASPTARRE